jgi:predicted nucleotidyltransferase
VLVWPNATEVRDAVREWAMRAVAERPEVSRIGYFGSYARGDWGVGSDVDLIVIVSRAEGPSERRSLSWDTTTLPVPADLLIYTEAEWDSLLASKGRFARTLATETVWAVNPVRRTG